MDPKTLFLSKIVVESLLCNLGWTASCDVPKCVSRSPSCSACVETWCGLDVFCFAAQEEEATLNKLASRCGKYGKRIQAVVARTKRGKEWRYEVAVMIRGTRSEAKSAIRAPPP